ncbi:acyltransferase [Blautia coccoides]|uniref:Acyltransferase n=2 Tax=Blautia producta TaxID=33035 RepID=A0A7G5N1S2_9FIRM|nr:MULTISPECIES: acyltransferase [Blautia]MCQ5125942.1 acyltransferase [Blautia producta]MCR1985485.1 acyltransferase [Blautia coccoides]QIB58704.1 acyltransferase [Blautia producta ATCC 27340 = DSM 2950]QMW80815.1 acyltransferase [Blautia producta]
MMKFINRLTNKVLKRELTISEDMPFTYLLCVIFQRVFMLIRGTWSALFFEKAGSPIFIGKKVKIKCKGKITAGNCVSFQDYVLIDALSKEGMFFGDNVSVGMRSMIKVSGSLTKIGKGFSMGKNSAMGNDCFIGAAGGVTIGEYVAIGQNVRFHSENHEFRDGTKMICEQGVTNEGITVGDDVWIGAGAVLLDGVHVGTGAVIGANTLVNKDVPDYAIAVGNPVKIVGGRK